MATDGRLKSLFILPAVTLSAVIAVGAGVTALTGGQERAAWLGATLAALPLPALFLWWHFRPVSRTHENLPFAILVSAAGAGISSWEHFIEGVTGWQPVAVALAGTLILLIYVYWYSRFGRIGSQQLEVGQKLPQFELSDADGAPFRSADFVGGPAVLLFYRGNWCPFCMAQVNEIAARYQELAALGVTVALISPQSAERTRQLAARFDLPIRYLVDPANRAATELGIVQKSGVPVGTPGGYDGETVMPTLVVTNAAGTIIFSDQTDNYRVRPEPDIFIAILKRAGAMAA